MTDNIHDTIYLSDFESELISTPYFYRLHDIYQSSTVYMTFPSNRTKRYEHSLGTMEIASSILYAAVSNAADDTRKLLFKRLKEPYEEILNLAIKKSSRQSAPYFAMFKELLDKLCKNWRTADLTKSVTEAIRDGLKEGCFADSALEHFQFYPMDITEQKGLDNIENIFLYRCLLQAVRIVALFHDVGHPPYSHILEDVIVELYKKYENVKGVNDWQEEQLNNFKDCFKEFVTEDQDEAYICQVLYSKTSRVNDAFHERVGLSFLEFAINETLPKMIGEIKHSKKNEKCKIATCIYYIMVVEFTIAMLAEKNMLFKSLHKIVDGYVDADRLDYIMRDSLNSGVDWGKIPYKRVINSARLFCISEYKDVVYKKDEMPFVIAYPKKVGDDIEDLLLVRYKIFARINFHHRCMKTSVALQTAVRQLVEDYLESLCERSHNLSNNLENVNCVQCKVPLNLDIKILWEALSSSVGDMNLRVIQWNDSWLISTLHKALIAINEYPEDSDSFRKFKGLKENLEEILLFRKRYYTLFKRGKDCKSFMGKVFLYAGISKEDILKLEVKEYNKILSFCPQDVTNENILFQSGLDAGDSLARIAQLKRAQETAGMEYLYTPLPLLERDMDRIIEDTFESFIKSRKLVDFKLIKNKGKNKVGIPEHTGVLDEIYLYDGETCAPFEDKTTLRNQIEAIARNIPWYYIYFVPGDGDVKELTEELIDKLAVEVGAEIRKRFQELFEKKE